MKMAVPSEETATRLIAPILEGAGMVYDEGSGWSLPGAAPAAAGREWVVGVVPDRGADALACCREGEADPVPSRSVPWAITTAVVVSRAADGAWVAAWLMRRGLPQPARLVALRKALRGACRVPRDAGLEEICGALGVRWLDSSDAAGHAAAMAACLAEAAARRREMGEDASGEDPADYPGAITADQIAALPESPGVYRFFDRHGDLIYVGKAANLKRRVSSWFRPGRAGGHGAGFFDRIHRLEIDTKPSELEALLEEQKQIRRRRPKGNVQFDVHERARPSIPLGASRCWALLLPAADGETTTAVLVRDGRYLGHLAIGPRGGGLAKSDRLLGRAVCSAGRSARAPRPEADRDTQILNTWLAKHGDAVSRIDLGDCRKASEAARALQDAARRLRGETGGPVEYR